MPASLFVGATKKTRRTVRLPTEAEWEYACRAGTTTQHSFGDNPGDLPDYAWCRANSEAKTHPVGQLRPNAWGLYDMHGNVWEWVSDWYGADYYVNSPREDPTGPTTGSDRPLHGGGMFSPNEAFRSAFRLPKNPSFRWNDEGFRVCASV